jgi:hypothetical protein
VQQHSWTLFPDPENKQHTVNRQNYMKQHWKYDVPPKEMSPLPKCQDKAAFIRIDQTVIGEMFPETMQRSLVVLCLC